MDEDNGEGKGDTFIDQKFELIMKNVRRGDINIVNIQNVKMSRIGRIVIEGLCLVDELTGVPGVMKSLIAYEPAVEIEEVPKGSKSISDPVNDFMDYLFDRKMSWREMQSIVKGRYVEKVLSRIGDRERAWLLLDISEQHWNQLKGKDFTKSIMGNPKHRQGGKENDRKKNLVRDDSFNVIRGGSV